MTEILFSPTQLYLRNFKTERSHLQTLNGKITQGEACIQYYIITIRNFSKFKKNHALHYQKGDLPCTYKGCYSDEQTCVPHRFI